MITDPPQLVLTLCPQKKQFVTVDKWHITHDMQHLTFDIWWTINKNFISLALTVWDLWCCEDFKEKDWSNEWMNEWMTMLFVAQATPGLLTN